MNPNVILDTPINWDEMGETTLRKAFKLLLHTLFLEGEGFSGKRPLGNSSWEFSLGEALIKAGILEGTISDDGYDVDFEWADFNKIIISAIDAL